MLLYIAALLLGFVVLIGGAEYLVRGSSSIAKRMGMSTIVIGLTIVAFGTSAPELIVNIFSSAKGATQLAIGNVVGSNLANILLILGVAASIKSLKVKEGTTFREIPFALLAIVMVAIMGNDLYFDGAIVLQNSISRIDGMILISFFVIFMYYTYGISKVEGDHEGIEVRSWRTSLAMLMLGIAGLAFGGKFIVDGATGIARIAGLSEALIGLTIVALGTSLPELATTIVAVRKGHTDLAIGNAVGSNIFNVFLVLGISATIRPLPFDTNINIDVLFTTGATLLLFIFLFVVYKHRLTRWQGFLFVILYLSYMSYVFIR